MKINELHGIRNKLKQKQKKNILLTGANGQIGQALVKKLIEIDIFDEIWILVKNERSMQPVNSVDQVQILYQDISKPFCKKLKKIIAHIDVVVHLAAIVHKPKASITDYYNTNYRATKDLVNCFRLHSKSAFKQFVYVSTVSVFGNYKVSAYFESDKCIPDTPYAISKFLAEEEIRKICHDQGGFNYTIVRPATVFCENDKGNIGKMIRFIKRFHFFPIFGDGSNKKSLVSVGDVTDGISKCIENEKVYNKTLNLSGKGYSVNEIVLAIKSALRIKIVVIYIPKVVLKFLPRRIYRKVPIFNKMTSNNVYSYHKAMDLIKYDPMPIDKGFETLFKKAR